VAFTRTAHTPIHNDCCGAFQKKVFGDPCAKVFSWLTKWKASVAHSKATFPIYWRWIL